MKKLFTLLFVLCVLSSSTDAGDSNDASMISGNPFDLIDAVSAGMKSAWVKRSDRAIFFPWEIKPALTGKNLRELCEKVDDQ